MKIKTCFFIGHRDAPGSLLPLLTEAVERHITEYGVTDFVVGQYGNFDRLAAQAVKDAKKRRQGVTLSLLLPYHPFDRPIPVPDGFDGTFYPPGMETVPKRAAIVRANRYMMENSRFLICYSKGNVGNTRQLVEAALRREKKDLIRVENLAEKLATIFP